MKRRVCRILVFELFACLIVSLALGRFGFDGTNQLLAIEVGRLYTRMAGTAEKRRGWWVEDD